MEERGSKEKVIKAINDYRRTILQDFWVEVQAIRKVIEVVTKFKDNKITRKFKKMLYSIKEDNLEVGLNSFNEFIRTQDEYEEYWELYNLCPESFEKIGMLAIDNNFMISAYNFTQLKLKFSLIFFSIKKWFDKSLFTRYNINKYNNKDSGMSSIEALKNIIALLEINPIWIVILLLVLIISCVCPWDMKEKVEETEEKDGKKVYRIFHFK